MQTIIKSILSLSEECDNVIVVTMFDEIIDEFLKQSTGKKIVETSLNISSSNKIIVRKGSKDYKAKIDNIVFTGINHNIKNIDKSIGGRNGIIVTPVRSPKINIVQSYDINNYDVIVTRNLVKFINIKRNDSQIISKAPVKADGLRCLVLSHYPLSSMWEMFGAESIDFSYDLRQEEYLDDNSIKRIEQQFNSASGTSINIDFIHNKTWVHRVKIEAILDALTDTGQVIKGINKQNLQYYYRSIAPFNYQKIREWGHLFGIESRLYQDMSEGNGKALEAFIEMQVTSHCLAHGDKAILYLDTVQVIDLQQASAPQADL